MTNLPKELLFTLFIAVITLGTFYMVYYYLPMVAFIFGVLFGITTTITMLLLFFGKRVLESWIHSFGQLALNTTLVITIIVSGALSLSLLSYSLPILFQ